MIVENELEKITDEFLTKYAISKSIYSETQIAKILDDLNTRTLVGVSEKSDKEISDWMSDHQHMGTTYFLFDKNSKYDVIKGNKTLDGNILFMKDAETGKPSDKLITVESDYGVHQSVSKRNAINMLREGFLCKTIAEGNMFDEKDKERAINRIKENRLKEELDDYKEM